MTQFQVIDGKNGYLHTRSEETGPSLEETINRFESEGVGWSAEEISEFANRFSIDEFHTGIREAVQEAISKSDITPDWYERYEKSG
jgi:hypothetical protein